MLPPESLPMPREWRELLEELAPAFARRSTFRLFAALACGLILADREFVKFLARGEGSRAELVHCPAYVLSWMRCEGCEGEERKPS